MNLRAVRDWLLGTLAEAGWAPGAVLAFWAIAAKGFDAYIRWPNLDIPTHFGGGLAIAYFFDRGIVRAESSIGLVHPFLRLLLVFALTAVAAVTWEFLEYLSDLFLDSHLNLRVGDTLSDLFFGLLGGGGYALVCFMVRLRPTPRGRD